ncbi:9439_t:CDS:1 [Gigaspora margarita]|uniref:9439_t:CDS:1 n=1 Tax=Gigaspora margarita TaxID=4874 RepID=A0ABM8W7C6_GIGMA|nr:9439_t:CDS:1 [Gigaspora margarita]
MSTENNKIESKMSTENNKMESKMSTEQEIINMLLFKNKELENQLEGIQHRNKELEKQVESSKMTIKRLTLEASKLGKAISVGLGDNDLNNVCQLKEDIKILKENLENFSIIRPAKDFGIIKNRADNLLKQYKCTIFINDEHYISLLQAAIQRYILESAIKYIEDCFSNPEHLVYSELEAQIVRNTDTLLNVMGVFAKSREGSDDVTPTLPIKLRQLIYSVLDNRGFNPIVSPEGTIEHPFISRIQEVLIHMANMFRIVIEPTKMKSFDDTAIKLARDIIKIFFFRLKVQEQMAGPPVWFEYNDRVNPDLMEGAFDPGHCQDVVVQICTFPLICINLENDEKRKILSKANVHIKRLSI